MDPPPAGTLPVTAARASPALEARRALAPG
jgi:hypothetical protein